MTRPKHQEEKAERTKESRDNDVIAGDDDLVGRDVSGTEPAWDDGGKPAEGLRGVNQRAADEQRAQQGDLEARTRRNREEIHNAARGDDSDLAWGAGGMQREDRSDSVTTVPGKKQRD